MSKPDAMRTETLSDQKQALRDYLDALLQEVPAEGEPAPVDPQPAQRQPLFAGAAPQGPAPVTALRQRQTPRPSSPQPLAAGPQPGHESEPATPVQTARSEADVSAQNSVEAVSAPPRDEAGPPAWAQPDFQALIFHVGGLKLAVPLVKLHSVVPWEDQITPMPNQPAWCHGLFHYRGHNVRVVDTATLVLPPEKRAEMAHAPPEQILVVGDGRWAMSCTRLGDVVRLRPEQVKWRTARGRRPWLAGTVREKLCAVMDTGAFADMLDRA